MILSCMYQSISSFVISPCLIPAIRIHTAQYSSWDDFADLGDDDLLDDEYASENDSKEYKAAIGSKFEAPDLEWQGDPISVLPGTSLPLTEENIQGLLQACRQEIETVFGYSAENRGVGITGGVDFVELDGPSVVLRLKGRFWHERSTVLTRVANYLQQRCPEIVDVTVDDEWQLSDEANRAE
uniref:NIF system FeS cluster assembly NifU C-terminal domain-containing protein n=1 Tax=Eucampia antarctica TaxID=49252 RepID=A0A7S2W728_9STRA